MVIDPMNFDKLRGKAIAWKILLKARTRKKDMKFIIELRKNHLKGNIMYFFCALRVFFIQLPGIAPFLI